MKQFFSKNQHYSFLKIDMTQTKKRKGQSLVEFSLVLPILILLIMGILEFGFLVKDFITLNYMISQVSKEASLMRGVQNGDLNVVKNILERTYGLDPQRLQIVLDNGNTHGPYFLDGDDVEDGNGNIMTGFPEPLFFFDDNGTPSDSSDDTPTTASNRAANYIKITLSYTHSNLGPYPQFMAMDNIVLLQTKNVRLE